MFELHENKRHFLRRTTNLPHRLKYSVMQGEVAHIPCKVQSIHDVLSKFSIEEHESLDPEFMDFVIDYSGYIPSQYPLVLTVYGPQFTPAEQQTITRVIEGDMDYRLGLVQADSFRRQRRFLFMMVGTIVSGLILTAAQQVFNKVPLEFFFVLFWLFADGFVRYIFIEKLDFKEERIRAGRLADMKVEYVEVQDGSDPKPGASAT